MPDGPTFDVLVIGAGSAGAVVAARASEHPKLDVCLVEAGPDYPSLAELPDDLLNSFQNSIADHDWGYEYRSTRGGRPSHFPRGRVVGGSSAVNTAIALRGVPDDYDHWAELGNPEWSWERVLPAFRRLERDLDFGDQPHHGDAGPITIRRYRDDELSVPQAAFLEAAAELGYPRCDDANDPSAWGAGPHPMNKAGRVRISTAIGYLSAARVRPNLTVRCGVEVARVLVEGSPPRAVGVELADGSRVSARLVVVSAGAIASPVLLQRSGVGPRAVLEAAGIEVAADVAGVGENLADHPALMVVGQPRDQSTIDFTTPLMQTILRYTGEGAERDTNLQIEQLSWVGMPGHGRFAVASVVEWSHSRGTVRLTGPALGAPVDIDSGLCSDERDADALAGCVLDTLRFFETKAIKALVDGITFPRLPIDRDTLRTLATRHSGSGYHPCGTVRMGPAEDTTAVVDQLGRSHAVDGLVVADASIFPTVPRANTNLTAIMVGEMVGEWIRTSPHLYGI